MVVVGPRGCASCSRTQCRSAAAGGFTTWWCPGCGHLTVDVGATVTSDTYDRADYAGFRPDPVFLRSAEDVLRGLEARLAGERLLDIGCGNGAGLQAAANVGFEAHGIDVSRAAVALCRSRGLSAEVRDVGDSELGGDWDIATMWDVLEHISEPRPFLRSVRDRLRTGGHVVIKIPTVSAAEARAVLRWSPRLGMMALQVPAHLNFFTERSLGEMLASVDFEVVHESARDAFRSRPKGGSVKRRLGRAASSAIMRICKGRQLLVVARAIT